MLRTFEEIMEAKIIGRIDLPQEKKIDLSRTGVIFKHGDKVIVNTKHGVDRVLHRGDGYTDDQLEQLFKNYINGIKDKTFPQHQEVLLFSKKFRQSAIFRLTDNKLVIITFLPKGKQQVSSKQADTIKLIVEVSNIR